jgi:hypothetical protein
MAIPPLTSTNAADNLVDFLLLASCCAHGEAVDTLCLRSKLSRTTCGNPVASVRAKESVQGRSFIYVLFFNKDRYFNFLIFQFIIIILYVLAYKYLTQYHRAVNVIQFLVIPVTRHKIKHA